MASKTPSLQDASEGGAKRRHSPDEIDKSLEKKSTPEKSHTKRKRGTRGGAKHTPKYIDSQAEYVAVKRSDLREIARFGWLEEGVGGFGMFFLSGAFWTAMTLLFDHFDNLKKVWPAFVICGMAMLFGGVLVWLARNHFEMRKERIEDYFSDKN